MFSLGGTGSSSGSETPDDGVGNNLRTLLKHPRKKTVKARLGNDECGLGQFCWAPRWSLIVTTLSD